ncbi:hypothetical protein KAH55_13020, partial [bacterium]|nr:hypothetical protein [bacterium]
NIIPIPYCWCNEIYTLVILIGYSIYWHKLKSSHEHLDGVANPVQQGPSSCSELLKHSDGRLFWIGNLVPNNPRGNRPRYPLVIGEVDQKLGLLIKETVTVLDTRQPDQSELMTLSNFYIREDRQTGDLILHVSPMFINSTPENQDWTADAMIYRIKVA